MKYKLYSVLLAITTAFIALWFLSFMNWMLPTLNLHLALVFVLPLVYVINNLIVRRIRPVPVAQPVSFVQFEQEKRQLAMMRRKLNLMSYIAFPFVWIASQLIGQTIMLTDEANRPPSINAIDPTSFGMALFTIAFIAPITEEIFFRGLLLKQLSVGFSVLVATFASTFMFALTHNNIVQSLSVVMLSLLNSVLYVTNDYKLRAPIVSHILFNVLALFLSFTTPLSVYESARTLTYVATAITTIVAAVIMGALLQRFHAFMRFSKLVDSHGITPEENTLGQAVGQAYPKLKEMGLSDAQISQLIASTTSKTNDQLNNPISD